jgi:hypothetical protein
MKNARRKDCDLLNSGYTEKYLMKISTCHSIYLTTIHATCVIILVDQVEKENVVQKRNEHLEEAGYRYKLKLQDKTLVLGNSQKSKIIMADLQ